MHRRYRSLPRALWVQVAMKLWSLTRPWKTCGYDQFTSMAVLASNEAEARQLAAQYVRDSNAEHIQLCADNIAFESERKEFEALKARVERDASVWFDPKVSCKVVPIGKPHVVLANFRDS